MCASIIPGRTVSAREVDHGRAGGDRGGAPGADALDALARTTMAWSRRGADDVPSIRVPAWMTVTAEGFGAAGWAETRGRNNEI